MVGQVSGIMTALRCPIVVMGLNQHQRSPNRPGQSNRYKSQNVTRDQRTTTIHAAGMAMLNALDVWPLVAKRNTNSRIKVAHGQSLRGRLSQRHKSNSCWNGRVMKRLWPMSLAIKTLLTDFMTDAARPVIQITGHEVDRFYPGNDFARLEFENRPDLSCQLVVACDGANSKLRDYASIGP